MFGKKKNTEAFDKDSFNFEINKFSKDINKQIEDYDKQIEEELAKACNYRKLGRTIEEDRCKKKIGRLLNSKLTREDQLDKIEATKDKINSMLTDMELARTVGKVYSGVGSFTSNKEMKAILKEIESFNSVMNNANKNINVLMETMGEALGKDNTDQVNSMVQAQYEQMMAGYEKQIEESANENFEDSEFVLK